MININKEIRLSRFDRDPEVTKLVARGYTFRWSKTKPKGFTRYFEVDNGQRICYTNGFLKAYMKACNEQKQTETTNPHLVQHQAENPARLDGYRASTREAINKMPPRRAEVGDVTPPETVRE